MTRARNKSHRDEALWQVYQLNAKSAADNRSEQRRNATRLRPWRRLVRSGRRAISGKLKDRP
jgi:hypothetical protein